MTTGLDLRAADTTDTGDARACPQATDGTGEHCDCWFNPPNGGFECGWCCFCDEGMPYCQQVEDDDSARREWCWVDAHGGGF